MKRSAIIAYPSGVVNMDDVSAKTTNPVSQAVRRLRLGLGDTQQQFANRLGLAISTVVRYELSRPPSGKALAQLDRLATDHCLDECALIFRNAIRVELAGPFQVGGVRPPSAHSVGFYAYPQTPEEEAMVFDVLSVMRKARDTTPPSNSSQRDGREQAKKELKALLKATKRWAIIYALITCIFMLVASLHAQSPSVQPALTFTTTGPGAAVANYNGAASWRLTFTPTGFTAATVQVESAEDCSGSPCATWTAINQSNVINGTNPVFWTASPVVSNTVAFKFNHPWLRVDVTSVTGTGSIQTLLLGYRGTKPI
ncbi:MAG TPA: helix-turn-helix domain-containing protein [Terracidiphilus sp.]|jgi:DNA-binding transcriptional regulator YiaG|nr:helix-turn-helix domain-containing protein [Terracidiphilus sp.]